MELKQCIHQRVEMRLANVPMKRAMGAISRNVWLLQRTGCRLTRQSSECYDGQSVAGAGWGSPGRRHKPVGRPANVCSPAASHAGA
eukprot:scaffold16012_cov14-Prasinocladus_malaysianus.AAC.1